MEPKLNCQCTNCDKRFAIDRCEGVNYSCAICDIGAELEFDFTKENRLKHEEEMRQREYNYQLLSAVIPVDGSCYQICVQGPRIKVSAILDLIGKHGLP